MRQWLWKIGLQISEATFLDRQIRDEYSLIASETSIWLMVLLMKKVSQWKCKHKAAAFVVSTKGKFFNNVHQTIWVLFIDWIPFVGIVPTSVAFRLFAFKKWLKLIIDLDNWSRLFTRSLSIMTTRRHVWERFLRPEENNQSARFV